MLHFGKVESDGRLEQVKGVTYRVERFLGAEVKTIADDPNGVVEDTAHDRVGPSTGSGTSLYHVILYLAPGDYHHFHSPVDWHVVIRRHFPGKALHFLMGHTYSYTTCILDF